MPSNEQRRQTAKRKLERQLQRRAQQVKRRRVIAIATSVIAVIAVVAGVFYFTRDGKSTTASAGTPQPDAAPACSYTPTPGKPAAKPVDLPQPPGSATGTQQISVRTNQGAIPIALDHTKAPCAANNFAHLTSAKFFDNTDCHRLTTEEGLKVLQCGDPSATGKGGPGYKFPDEPPKDLKPAPAPYSEQGARIYPRGTLAMANNGANTNGSQFFMVYGDSYLPPAYTAFGTIDEAGLKVLDKVAAAGATPPDEQTMTKPNLPVHIEQATSA